MWRPAGEEGFVLLETLVSMSLIAVVMAAFTTFFVNSVAFTSRQRATQVATQIANSAVDTLRALPSSDLLKGHDATSVNAQFDAVSSTSPVYPWLSSMARATDLLALVANTGLTAAVRTGPAPPQTVNNIAYTSNVYLGTCAVPAGTLINSADPHAPATCVRVDTLTGIPNLISYLRAVVAVTWTGSRCPPAGCSYVTSTLFSTVDDPLFNTTSSPPAAPVLTQPTAQISAVGDTVSLLPIIVAIPSYSVAVTSGSLPAGLILTPATGLISGTPTAVQASTSVTLTVTDGFGRAATATFSWTVVAALTSAAPAAQASLIGTAITPLFVTASGGVPGYTWSDPLGTLPPGLSLTTVTNQARITGTPTTTGITLPLPVAGVTFPVTLTVTDSTTKRKTTVSFSWTVNYPPFVVANPGPQTSTVGAPDPVALSVTGGSGSFAWTGTLPPGLTLTPAGAISGTPTTAGVTSVTLTATDTKISGSAQTFTIGWTVFARPTVTTPDPVVRDVGESVSLQLATTCPNAPCTYVLTNGPATLGINSSGLITGTVTAAQTFSAVTVTVTDSSGGTGSATFAVTVNALPTISSPGNQTVTPGSADSLNVAALVSGGTPPLTYSQTGLPTWLTLNTSTGAITGTAPNTPGTTTGITLTVTDARGKSAVSPAFSWIVVGGPSAPTGVTAGNGNGTVNASWTAPTGTVTGYTATLTSLSAQYPGGGSCTTTGALSCTISGLTNGVHYSLTVTATNSVGTSPASTAVMAIPYPASVMSAANGMTLWLDGADPSVLLSSCAGAATTTAIGCWKDKSGQATANNFSQATSGNQPTVGTWNGLPAANFADSSDVLSSVNASAQYRTVFFAANVTNPAAPNVIVNLFGQAGQDYNARIGSDADRRTQSSQNANDWAYNTGNPPQNWANGAQGANAVQPLAVITTDQSASVKTFTASVSNTFGGRGLTGQVGDVITFNKVMSTAERQTVEAYLSNKWGVAITSQTLTPPQAPTGVTASSWFYQNPVVSWIAPTNNGGAPITSYTVTSSPGGFTCTTSGLTCTATGALPFPYAYYTFTVTATNSVGVGPPSAPSSPVLL